MKCSFLSKGYVIIKLLTLRNIFFNNSQQSDCNQSFLFPPHIFIQPNICLTQQISQKDRGREHITKGVFLMSVISTEQIVILVCNRCLFQKCNIFRNIYIVNFFAMETSPKNFYFCDDEKIQLCGDPLHHLVQNNQMVQLCEEREEQSTERNIQLKYYLEFKKIYFTSYKLWAEIRKQVKVKEGLAGRISHLETQLIALHRNRRNQEVQEEADQAQVSSRRKNAKRTRRTAEEIERKHCCQAEFCDRVYGSEGSLQQHIKLKHPELYKGDQEQEI